MTMMMNVMENEDGAARKTKKKRLEAAEDEV
jgi:hypothetical protein